MAARESVIDLIRRLLTLTESPNVHEAASAAANARRLMEKHAISSAQLADAPEEVRDRDLLWTAEWLRRMAVGVARAFFCREVCRPDRVQLVGRGSDVAAAHLLLTWLRAEAERLLAIDFRPVRLGVRSPAAWKNAWRHAFADEVSRRLKEEDVRGDRTGTDLVLLSTYRKQAEEAVEGWFSAHGVSVRQVALARPRRDADALSAGRAAGASVALKVPERALPARGGGRR